MSIVIKCDRCGECYAPEVSHDTGRMRYQRVILTLNTFGTTREQEFNGDLCNDCHKSLKDWINAGKTTGAKKNERNL